VNVSNYCSCARYFTLFRAGIGLPGACTGPFSARRDGT